MKIVGHDGVIRALDKKVPHVSLFLGPKGVGKWTTAQWTIDRLGVPWSDVLMISRLDPDTADQIRRFSNRGGSTDKGQVVVVRVGSLALNFREQLMDIIDHAPSTRFILLATDMPTHSLASRGQVYRFGLLTQDQVAEILTLRGAKPGEAKVTASYSAGSMDILWLAKQITEVKPIVQQALRALHERDSESLEMIAPRWSEIATQWLTRWCSERYTGRWRWFNAEFTEIEDPQVALRVLLAVSQDVRPALVVRSSLMTLIKER